MCHWPGYATQWVRPLNSKPNGSLSYLKQQEDVVVFEQPKRNAIHHKDCHTRIRLKSDIRWRQADEARWCIEDYYEAVVVLLVVQSVVQGYQPAKFWVNCRYFTGNTWNVVTRMLN